MANVSFIFIDTFPDFTITAPASLSFPTGSAIMSSVTVTPENGFFSQVNLIPATSPREGLAITFDPATILYGSGTSTTPLTSSKPGAYTLTITGKSRQIAHITTVQVNVTSQTLPDFIIGATLSSLTVQPGNSVTSTISISPVFGFGGTVTLRAAISPSGPIATLSLLNMANAAGSSNLTVNVGSEVAIGNYTATIDATSGTIFHTKEIAVMVGSIPSPTAPAPSSILGLSRLTFYGAVTGGIVLLMAGFSIVLRRCRTGRFHRAKCSLSPAHASDPTTPSLRNSRDQRLCY